jgi:hypothetical protein
MESTGPGLHQRVFGSTLVGSSETVIEVFVHPELDGTTVTNVDDFSTRLGSTREVGKKTLTRNIIAIIATEINEDVSLLLPQKCSIVCQ